MHPGLKGMQIMTAKLFLTKARRSINRRTIGTLGLLIVLLISIENPIPDIKAMLYEPVNLNSARDYYCMNEIIPHGTEALFIGDTAGNSNILAAYFRTQYHLLPRLIHLAESVQEVRNYPSLNWLISQDLSQDQLQTLTEDFHSARIANCGPFIILHRTE
jgi:hypothetical protein